MTKKKIFQLVGWRAGTKKDGKKYNVLHLISVEDPLPSQRGDGSSVVSVWNVSEELLAQIIQVGFDNTFEAEVLEVNFRTYITRVIE